MILQEIKARWKSSLIWVIVTAAMMAWGMTEYKSMAPTMSLDIFTEKLPKVMMAMYGMYGVDLNSLQGYFGVMLFFFTVIFAVHGAFLGCSLIDNEFRDRTAEFLFSKPSSRRNILLRKFVAGLIMLLIFQAVMTAVNYFILSDLRGLDLLWPSVIGLFFTHLFFYILGFGLTALLPTRMGQRVSLIVIALGYLAVVFSQLFDRPELKNITPIGLYGNSFLDRELSTFALPTALFIGAVLVLLAIGLWRFERRDLEI